MRKILVLSTLLVFGLGGAPAAAQTFGFGAHAGASIPTGDYSEGTNLGFLGGIDLWYPLTMATSGLSWYTSADAIAHSVDDEDVDSGFLYVPVMTGLRFDVPIGPVAAFGTGQLGLIVTKGPSVGFGFGGVTAEAESSWGTNFGFNVGGGLQLTDNIYAGAKYYPLGDLTFEYEGDQEIEGDVSFVDIYVGFGVR